MNQQLRRFFLALHRWIGLVTGMVVCIVCFTGFLFVFEEEVTKWYHKDLLYVKPKEKKLSISKLKEIYLKKNPEKEKIKYYRAYPKPNRSVLFLAYKENDSKSLYYFNNVEYWTGTYLDPYTGLILGHIDHTRYFFGVVRSLHQHLLLRYDIGSPIVGYSILLFIVMLISGFALWLPRRLKKNNLKQRLQIKWRGISWRRINFDIHAVGGFYTLLFALILAVSGLTWSFKWWSNGLYKLLGTLPKEAPVKARESTMKMTDPKKALDHAYIQALAYAKKKRDFTELLVYFPKKETDETKMVIKHKEHHSWTSQDDLFFDSQTGLLNHKKTFSQKNTAERFKNSKYNIHTAKIYGLWGKFLGAFVSLFCFLLPISGFIIWLGKRKKKSKGKNRLIAPKTKST